MISPVRSLLFAAMIALSAPVCESAEVQLFVDTTSPGKAIDLPRYGLGQGGLSSTPMFDVHVPEISLLRPKTIRLFVQEYFNLLPERGRYHWDTLDRSIENILKTGAKPLLSLCFKPKVLYPENNHDIVHPNDYEEWEKLIEAMVRHCNMEKKYGVEYWEVGNEVDIGESGGCPYRFQPGDYLEYYTRTARAILRADPSVKVGGPALASHASPIGDALIEHCAKGNAPLHFFSWHIYSNDPEAVRGTIRSVKQKLSRFPTLAETETILDEWNIGLIGNEKAPGFQAAFILETTGIFHQEGLSRAAYYHIRDHFVAPEDFRWMSPEGYRFMSDWWNVKIQNSGLFDKQGRRRPAYYVFQMLGHFTGPEIPVTGATNGIRALAVRSGSETHVAVWNFNGPPKAEVVLRFPPGQKGQFHLARLDPVQDRMETLRTGSANELDGSPASFSLDNFRFAWLRLGEIKVRATWGHSSGSETQFKLALRGDRAGFGVSSIQGVDLETGEQAGADWVRTIAGGGDIDGVDFSLALPTSTDFLGRRPEQSIWKVLIEESAADDARRIRQDPSNNSKAPTLMVEFEGARGRGFSVEMDQLLSAGAMWVPAYDVFLCAGEPFIDWAAHQRALSARASLRTRTALQASPEATHAQYTNAWEDMGSPEYRNPHSVPPGHVVCITWDGAIPKFGVDRNAGVIPDLGAERRFSLDFRFDGAAPTAQKLVDALPIIETVFEKDGVRYQVEQFAYPLHGPPAERRGDIPMVLLQKVSVVDMSGSSRTGRLEFRYTRELPEGPDRKVQWNARQGSEVFTDSVSGDTLLSIQGEGASFIHTHSTGQHDKKKGTVVHEVKSTVDIGLGPNEKREFVIQLPSPVVPVAAKEDLEKLSYADARARTHRFWSDYLARGAVFQVPEAAVNDLFRANLWHALRLPRRHGGTNSGVIIDLPYSNFAYGQTGTPWPVNQAVYVDYMLYDLRGYHDVAREELAAIYRNNQEGNGHVGGYANWGVYTPGMLYSVAKHFLLSGDGTSFESLLPQTLKALEWCLERIRTAVEQGGKGGGLVLDPLNDLSHDPRAWAFNQAYFYGGIETLGRALQRIGHPRAEECLRVAQQFKQDVQEQFGRASARSTLVQLRDHSWSPYVPGDAMTPRRMMDVWYPTDVDTGPMHLVRLKALDANSLLAEALLDDHEDNLFLKALGMANEPVYNQHATAYLLRDDVLPVIRSFYSMIGCAFSHKAYEPVEHRWGWGQYFGPPSTDGAWFELYRHMLIHELDDDALLLGQATPRGWLEDGKKITVRRAPTYFGPMDMEITSAARAGDITAEVRFSPGAPRPKALLVRLRHPEGKRIRRVEVNGQTWTDFDVSKEWVRIPSPAQEQFRITAHY